jgi:hypothetical protein
VVAVGDAQYRAPRDIGIYMGCIERRRMKASFNKRIRG